ncbi:hypothetical protein M408DRAFT_20826 [Serendipita vermifera MAFF 305830]|uniref:F-box domain-containing protein n=1 Tax=Serendipita vermifera MAFF 305830 TaxID=933852 RepID=A0A0C2WZX2_SERVB|nr:hypothetical protein M408DRAFT_20826 [Serendipita vermifera MAFF 305830]
MAEEQARGHPHQKGLPTELWKTIFHEATKFPYKDEFTTNPYAYFPFSWSSQAYFPTKAMESILQTRFTIILVCKTWYTLGIADLYSHVYFDPTSPMSKSLHRVFAKKISLLAHVRRLTLRPPRVDYSKWSKRRAQSGYMKMAIAIISSLPRLRVLDASPETAAVLPIKRLSSTVQVVAIAAWDYGHNLPRPPQVTRPISAIAWQAVHVLHLDVAVFHRGMLDTQVNFQSVIRFALRDEKDSIESQDMDWETVGRIFDNWAFPSLQRVVIKSIDWPTMSTFLQRHSMTLQSLYFESGRVRLERVSAWLTETLILPNLRELKLKTIKNIFPYLNLDPIALESFEFDCILIIQEGLPYILDLLGRYQTLKSCRIYGHFSPDLALANRLLEHVVDQLATLRKRGVTVEIHSTCCWNPTLACKGECCPP